MTADPMAVTQLRNSFTLMQPRSIWYAPRDFKPQVPGLLSNEGFVFERATTVRKGIRMSGVGISLPFWFIAMLFLSLPAVWLVGRCRRMIRSESLGQTAVMRGTGRRPALTRRLPTVFAAISLLLFIAIMVAIRLTNVTGQTALFTSQGVLYQFTLQNGRLLLVTVGDWPGTERLRLVKRPDGGWLFYPFRESSIHPTGSSLLGFAYFTGHVQMFLEPDGAVMLLPYGRDSYYFSLSAGLPIREIVLSLRALALAAAILPLAWGIGFTRYRIRRRIALNHGLCATCGYNLAGNISGVCPECGTKVQQTYFSGSPATSVTGD